MKKSGLKEKLKDAGFEVLIERSLVNPLVYKIFLLKNDKFCYFLSSLNGIEWIDNSFDKPELDVIVKICREVKNLLEYNTIYEMEG